MTAISTLVTGAAGYLGRVVVGELAARKRDHPGTLGAVLATDVRTIPTELRQPGVEYAVADVRSDELATLMAERDIDVVAHLAAVVTPGRMADRERLHSVEVGGTENVLESCLRAGVHKIIVTSSGAAYGYHPDNPAWLDEDDPLRGNVEFAYADHKRQVEEMLASWRRHHPELEQLVLRPGTILGATTHNQITALLDARVVVGIRGAETPFVLVWDQDVAEVFVRGITTGATGVYNLAGDGALPLSEMAAMLGKPYLPLPATLVRAALWGLHRFGLTPYGPEQVDFLRYRPVLNNRRLKEELGYTPQKTSREVFEYFLEARRHAVA